MKVGRFVVPAGVALAGCKNSDSVDPTDTGSADGPPTISLSVTDLAFEARPIGTLASKTITVRNDGLTELDIESVTVAEPFGTTFTNHVSLQAGGITIVNVTFSPTALGTYEETVAIGSTDPTHPNVDVTCTGSATNDADGDGFDAGYDPGDDCDDDNPNINPAANEIWYNGRNDNCVCEEPTRCSDFDQDLDGWDYIYYNANVALNGGDCDDADVDISPDATEVANGADDDCDGMIDE